MNTMNTMNAANISYPQGMPMQTNAPTMQPVSFVLPSISAQSEFDAADLEDDTDGLQLNFPRVKIPSGGALQFELPTDNTDSPDYTKYLEGVILYSHATNAYWPEGGEYDDNTPPLCSSIDGKQGIGEPGGACATCMLNRFGTGVDAKGNPTKGKACKNMRSVYLLRSGDYMPLQLLLPPTSIKPYTDFVTRSFTIRRRASYGSVVQIGLSRKNTGGMDYSVATFTRLYDFEGESLAQIRAYTDSFKKQTKAMNEQRADARQEQSEEVPGYPAALSSTEGPDGTFCIDGDREALPA